MPGCHGTTKHTSNILGTCHLVRKELQCVSDLLAIEVFSVSSCFKTQVKVSCKEEALPGGVPGRLSEF